MLYLMGEIMEINEMGLELMEGLPIVWMPRFIRKRVNSKIFFQLLHRKKLRFKVVFVKLYIICLLQLPSRLKGTNSLLNAMLRLLCYILSQSGR